MNKEIIDSNKIHSDKEIFEAILACYPWLSPNGFDTSRTRKNDDSFSLLEFQAARKWLKGIGKITRMIPCDETHSYYLKHRAEEVTGVYISNGHLIAAAIAEGFCFQCAKVSGPNVFINADPFSVRENSKRKDA